MHTLKTLWAAQTKVYVIVFYLCICFRGHTVEYSGNERYIWEEWKEVNLIQLNLKKILKEIRKIEKE